MDLERPRSADTASSGRALPGGQPLAPLLPCPVDGAELCDGSVLAVLPGALLGTHSEALPKGVSQEHLSGRATPVGPRCAYTLVRLESN